MKSTLACHFLSACRSLFGLVFLSGSLCLSATEMKSGCAFLGEDHPFINDKDFAQSSLYTNPQNLGYAEWSVRVSREVLNKLRAKDQDFPKIIDEVAKSRGDLANQIQEGDQESRLLIGKRRVTSDRASTSLSIGISYDTYSPRKYAKWPVLLEMATNRVRLRLAYIARYFMPWELTVFEYFNQRLSASIRSSSFTGADGVVIKDTTRIVEITEPFSAYEDQILIEHPNVETAKRLEVQSFAFLKMAYATKEPNLRDQHLKNAIMAWFRAMPFTRGSAAIGRVFWTAVIKDLVGTDVRLFSEIDILAMIFHPSKFQKYIDFHEMNQYSGEDYLKFLFAKMDLNEPKDYDSSNEPFYFPQ